MLCQWVRGRPNAEIYILFLNDGFFKFMHMYEVRITFVDNSKNVLRTHHSSTTRLFTRTSLLTVHEKQECTTVYPPEGKRRVDRPHKCHQQTTTTRRKQGVWLHTDEGPRYRKQDTTSTERTSWTAPASRVWITSTFLDVATGDDYILYQHAVVEINVELTDFERTRRVVNRTIPEEEANMYKIWTSFLDHFSTSFCHFVILKFLQSP